MNKWLSVVLFALAVAFSYQLLDSVLIPVGGFISLLSIVLFALAVGWTFHKVFSKEWGSNLRLQVAMVSFAGMLMALFKAPVADVLDFSYQTYVDLCVNPQFGFLPGDIQAYLNSSCQNLFTWVFQGTLQYYQTSLIRVLSDGVLVSLGLLVLVWFFAKLDKPRVKPGTETRSKRGS